MKSVLGIVLGLGLCVGACRNESNTSGSTTTSGAVGASNENAIHMLVTARCDREESCTNIGSGKDYADRSACVKKMKASVSDDLRTAECPGGVDRAQLDKCMNEIRGERCDHPLDTLSRVASCRTSALCLR